MHDDLKKRLSLLVESFTKNESAICNTSSAYNEAEVRSDFLNEFFTILGWDVANRKGLPRPLREVILEANVNVEAETKKPDYEFRFNGNRKFYVEAKKPSVDILSSKKPAFQTRRYGWSAKLPISILTNFKSLVIYDCSYVPSVDDNPNAAVIKQYNYTDYIDKFDEIYELISRNTVTEGKFDEKFSHLAETKRGDMPFDTFFLEQIEKWRLELAEDLLSHNKNLSDGELNYLIQVFINRIVFLRICEDRNLEPYGSLRDLDPEQAVKGLMTLFYEADKKYDSGLFDFIKDKLSPSTVVSNEVLIDIVQDLYYPKSPYTFSVIDPQILGSIYEQFISKTISIHNSVPTLEIKPEIKAANGVFSTPPPIVAEIVRQSFEEYLSGNNQTEELFVADTSCGSGVFLLEAYQYLISFYLKKYIDEEKLDKLRMDDNGDHLLTLQEKKNILLKHIFGVDIDEQAVEVAKFSLLLKVLEDIPNGEIKISLEKGIRALPSLEENIKCGNSLIGDEYIKFRGRKLDNAELNKIKPFSWKEAFSEVFNKGGFDIIVGNPPYTKIQNLMLYAPEESSFYKDKASPYLSSKSDNFDKYQIFIERSISLLKQGGVLGYIIPHKFMITRAGQASRKLISSGDYLRKVVHFGTEQVFGNRSTTYTCILLLKKEDNQKKEFSFEKVHKLTSWQNTPGKNEALLSTAKLSDEPWIFPSQQEKECFEKIESLSLKLSDIAEIFVGLQTSADNIFIITPTVVDDNIVRFKDKIGTEWEIEKDILKNGILDSTVNWFLDLSPNRLVIFPYELIGDEYKVFSESELQKKFPKTYAYLTSFKINLSKRDLSNGTHWYQYGRAQSLNKFNTDKLVIKNPALLASVAYDSQNVLFTGGGNGPYYGIRPKNDFPIFVLLAILNHPIFDRWVKLRSSVFRGNYYSFGKQFMENFPIADFTSEKNKHLVSRIVDSWKNIIKLNKECPRTPEKIRQSLNNKRMFKRLSDDAIFKIYDINPAILDDQLIDEE